MFDFHGGCQDSCWWEMPPRSLVIIMTVLSLNATRVSLYFDSAIHIISDIFDKSEALCQNILFVFFLVKDLFREMDMGEGGGWLK